jgi:cation diffusion facilitator family transporter
MIKLIIKKTIKNYKDTENEKVRECYGVLAGTLGIICNFILFCVKLVIGTIMNSIAITSDAMNNLSDMGSSVISIVSSKMSNQKPDKDHPFGHGRIEYVGSLIVSFIIILVGFELLRTSIDKIINPEIVQFNISLVIILALSVLIKFWMFSYNKYIAKTIKSSLMDATAQDSLNDSISTGAVILSLFIGQLTTLPVDAIMGLLVSAFIMVSGIKLAKEVIDVILGTPPSLETVKKISDIVLSGEGIVGIHDLIVHEYGPGRVFASVHAEVPDDVDIVKVHEVIDALEQRVQKELNFVLVIHMDPISVNDEKTQRIKKIITEITSEISSELSIHDFRMTDGENNINLIFDLVVPIETSTEDRKKYVETISGKLKEIDSRYSTVIQIDNAY